MASLTVGGVSTAAPPPTDEATTGLARFQRQTIAWHDCRTGPDDETGRRLDAAGARCGEVTVPLDYRRPDGRTITVAVARRAATDTANRRGTLVVNTGGPGPSLDGVSILVDGSPPDAPHGSPAVAARYDLVGIDPRFFGRSTPLECGWSTGGYLRSAQYASPSRAAFEQSVTVAKDLATRCAGYRDVLPYASTRNIARDLDVVRAALGESRISYLGWSFGSYLGAVYLQMFPRRTDRFVIDSAIDPDAYGPGVVRETGPATAAALRDWAKWAARHDGQYGLGSTTDRVLATVDRINRAAPFQVGDHRIDAAMIPGLLLPANDFEESYVDFSGQVRVLRDAARGDTVTPTPTLALKLALYASPDVNAEFGFSAATANQCADRAASRDPETYYRDIQAHRATEPLYGPLTRDITPCAFWPTDPVEAPTRVDNDRPVLIVGASGDSATPYTGQQAMHRALRGSRLVTLDRSFRHGVYLFALDGRVDETVDRYLVDGVLPATDVVIPRTG